MSMRRRTRFATSSPGFAGIGAGEMPRPTVTRLKETLAAAPRRAEVIDVEFKVVGRRTIFGRIARFMLALAIAALVGALIPVAWAIVDSIAAMLTEPSGAP